MSNVVRAWLIAGCILTAMSAAGLAGDGWLPFGPVAVMAAYVAGLAAAGIERRG